MTAGSALELTIVIPAYNEEKRLPATLNRIQEFLDAKGYAAEVIVVDDGSTDSTAAVVQACKWPRGEVRLLRNHRNRGKGYSVRRGVLESRATTVLMSDADLSAPIEEADKLLGALAQGWDLVIGSRTLNPELLEVPQQPLRRLAGRIFGFLVRLLMRIPFADTQCGFKAFRRESVLPVFRRLRIEGFGFDPEILFLARQEGVRVLEIGVRWRDDPHTRVHLLRDSLRMAWALLRVRWHALAGHYRGTARGSGLEG